MSYTLTVYGAGSEPIQTELTPDAVSNLIAESLADPPVTFSRLTKPSVGWEINRRGMEMVLVKSDA